MNIDLKTEQKGTISIRPANASDSALLLELGSRTFHETFAEVNSKEDMDIYLSKNFNAEQVQGELLDPANTFLIAESNGMAVGYAKLRKGHRPQELKGSNSIEIERVYASKAFIGKQVGYTLMQACLTLAKQEGYDTVWLGVWEHNHRAIAFYHKCGFEKFSTHPFMLGNDLQTDFLMKKELTG